MMANAHHFQVGLVQRLEFKRKSAPASEACDYSADHLISVKKIPEAIAISKKLFHLSTSFVNFPLPLDFLVGSRYALK